MTTAYHYTTFANAIGIVHDMEIKLSIPRPGSDNITAVWFSVNQHFEKGMGTTAMNPATGETKEVSRQEIADKLGLVRFGTSPEVLTRFTDILAMGQCVRMALLSRMGDENLEDWYIYPRPFPMRLCTGADLYLDGEWKPMTRHTVQAMSDRLPNGFGTTSLQLF